MLKTKLNINQSILSSRGSRYNCALRPAKLLRVACREIVGGTRDEETPFGLTIRAHLAALKINQLATSRGLARGFPAALRSRPPYSRLRGLESYILVWLRSC